MERYNKRNLIHLDQKEITFHEFEKLLFNSELSGDEKIQSKILTDGKEKILKETRLWEIVHKLLKEIEHHDEFSDRLREEIRRIISSEFEF